MSLRIPAGNVIDIPASQGVCITHDDETYAVFRIGDRFFACSGRCPHAGGPLHDGFLRGTEVVCPWHGWSFELDCADDAPKDGVLRYPVVVEGDEIFIELPAASADVS